jgi:predicted transcriptional regulator
VDIIADILSNAEGGKNITDIMYNTRLSYAHMKTYLKMLTENGLLAQETSGKKAYRTTEQGAEYLELYSRIRDLTFPEERVVRKPK